MIFSTNLYRNISFGLWGAIVLSLTSTVFAKKLTHYTFEAAYKVIFNDYDLGYTRISLTKMTKDENLFKLQAKAKTAGFIGFFLPNTLSETSLMQLTPKGLRTLNYEYIHKSGNAIEDQYRIKINYAKKMVKLTGNDPQHWKIDSDLITDRLNFAFVLADDFRRNKPLRNPMIILDGSSVLITKVRYTGSQRGKKIILRNYEFKHDEKGILNVSLNQRNRFIPQTIHFSNDDNTVIYKLESVVWTEIDTLD